MSYVCFECGSRFPINNGFCTYCLEPGTIMLEPRRPTSAARDGLAARSARDLVKAEWSSIESTAYPELRLGPGSIVLLYGPPGQGKSTMATKLLDGFSGPVVYLAAEEKLGPQVGERLSRLGVKRSDFSVVGQGSIDEVVDHCRELGAVALAVDSIQATSIQPAELRPLLTATGARVLCGTMQVTKAGLAAGSNAYLHESDVNIAIDDFAWLVEKSRFQGREAGTV